jgi:hypothetical protein
VAALALTAAACSDDGVGTGPPIHVDAAGFFIATANGPDADEEWYPGPGVACLLPLPGEPQVQFVGRLEQPGAVPHFYKRAQTGALLLKRSEVLGMPPGLTSLADAGLEAVLRVHTTSVDPAIRRKDSPYERLWALLAAVDPVRTPAVTPYRPARPADRSPPAPGADLAAWAPRDALFVRFRSTAAAYRLVGELDVLAALLLVRAGDGRDHGALRLTLHDLLLPSIWHANPGAEKGVGEVGLVVAPPFVRGRLRAALLLRITEPELHGMQTKAALALESRPDHLWRPADDPFPELRARRNHRRQVGDVEIVATDAELLEDLAAGVPALTGDLDYQAARGAASTGDGRTRFEAAFGYLGETPNPPAGSDLRAERGWRRMIARWSGLPETQLRGSLPAPAGPLPPIRTVHVVTHVKGADVVLELLDEEAAVAVEATLGDPVVPADAVGRACIANVRDLSCLAVLEKPAGDLAERCFVSLGFRPTCAARGTYTADPVTRAVRCSAHGTLAKPKSPQALALPVSEVTRDGNRVSFRLEIDWTRRQ